MLSRKGYSSKRMSTEYGEVNVQSEIDSADPHRLVGMLLEGALVRIFKAKVEIEQNRVEEKIAHLTQAVAIVDSLKSSLNFDVGGEIVEQLSGLYDYITRQLVVANSQNSIEILDEVTLLLKDVNEAWSGIRTEVRSAKVDRNNMSDLNSIATSQNESGGRTAFSAAA